MKQLFFFVFFWIATLTVHSQTSAIQEIPNLWKRVTDNTATLSDSSIAGIENRLKAFEEEKGSQVAVLIVSTVSPETIEEYSIRLAEKWKIGRENIDDGVILLIAKNDRKIRIEVGYGLEGAITDAKASQIIETIIVPRFKYGNFDEGVIEAINAITGLIRGEELPINDGEAVDDFSSNHLLGLSENGLWTVFLTTFFIGSFIVKHTKWFGFIVGIFIYFVIGLTDGFYSGVLFALLFIGASFWGFLADSSGGSSWSSSSSSGSSSYSSGGGSSFGGGGGSFGGGGASGGW